MEHRADDLARLEKFVDTLLDRHAQLKAEYLTLQHTLQEREQEIKRLEQEVEELFSEREEIGGRVGRLLDRIDHWQQEQRHLSDHGPQQGGNG